MRLDVADVEIAETEHRARAAVALLVDTSWSMVQEGRWLPMKRTALALHQLISTRYRNDALQLITFGRYAGVVELPQLIGMEGTWEQGTNAHHALLLAGRHLRRHPDAQPVVLMVTDGEPTAHLEPDGTAEFDYPPRPATLRKTVAEVDRLAKLGASLTVFRLGDDPRLNAFVDLLARRVRRPGSGPRRRRPRRGRGRRLPANPPPPLVTPQESRIPISKVGMRLSSCFVGKTLRLSCVVNEVRVFRPMIVWAASPSQCETSVQLDCFSALL